MPPQADLATEATRAGLYAVIGGGLLKIAESLLSRAGRKHRETLQEIEASVHAGAAIREELRKDIEHFRNRAEKAEAENERLGTENASLRKMFFAEESARKDAEAEVRILRRAQRTPIPPSRPPEGDKP